jgi:hypothetical protein
LDPAASSGSSTFDKAADAEAEKRPKKKPGRRSGRRPAKKLKGEREERSMLAVRAFDLGPGPIAFVPMNPSITTTTPFEWYEPQTQPNEHQQALPQRLAALTGEAGGGGASLAQLAELRTNGDPTGVLLVTEALLNGAGRLSEREQETYSFERVRALVRLERVDACQALRDHAARFPNGIGDLALLLERARCAQR